MSPTHGAPLRPDTPAAAWAALREGNERFVAATPAHPNQDVNRRNELTYGQAPLATFFGCSDSRVAAEVIFDQGLGDLFVIRTAGHVLGPTELGSMEFGAAVLGVPLIVVLGHDSCGAVTATTKAVDTGVMPGGFLRDLVERIMPSVLAAQHQGIEGVDAIMTEHVRQTVRLIPERSKAVAELVDSGKVAIVGLTYDLAEGRARVVEVAGDIGGTAQTD